MRCRKNHWEDEQPSYDAHVLYQSLAKIQYGHQPELQLVKRAESSARR